MSDVDEGPGDRPVPTHPGVFLRDVVLPAVKEGKAEIARRLGVNRSTFYQLLDGDFAVTPEMALKLSKLFGNSAQHWLNMQMRHDLALARVRIADQLEEMKPLERVAPE